ncbi:hypothetical protein [Phytohabitans rumicis]|uniref:Glycosyltransferase RgtA/B/C/D-like domain-containing protein n=1 Tax=Phytohabitans rumicis TaxID=1076125 RepID=A0A6V8KY44_9ACTN|nr:hypothetical protein [Phytohabitans rumicis]GFJ90022.1 hypothetical protein Prum_036640 [Phytohabitans rumicis]
MPETTVDAAPKPVRSVVAAPHRRTLPRPPLVLAALLAGYLTARVMIWFNGRVATYNDTQTYAYRGDPAFDHGPLVSFTGHSPRLWGTPLLYWFFPTDGARAFAQWTLGTVAWALLAWALWTALRTPVARVLAAGTVLVIGLLTPVANWDFAILSESPSINFGVLTLALLIRWTVSRSRLALGALTFTAFWWTFTRPEIMLWTAVLAVVLAGFAWSRRRDRRGWVPVLAAAAVVAGGVGWAFAITPVVSTTFQGWSATGLSLEEETLNYRLRIQVLPDPRIKEVYRDDLGMPQCPGAEQAATGKSWAIRQFAAEYKACPELKAWGERNASSSGIRFALAAPGLFASYVDQVAPASLGGAQYGKMDRFVPTKVDRFAFPAKVRLIKRLVAGIVLALVAAVAAVALRRQRLLALVGVAVLVVSLGGLVSGLLYSAGEYVRFGIQEAVFLRVGLVIAVIAGIDAMLSRRSRPGEPPASAPDR